MFLMSQKQSKIHHLCAYISVCNVTETEEDSSSVYSYVYIVTSQKRNVTGKKEEEARFIVFILKTMTLWGGGG